MSKPLVARSGGKRQILWRRVCARGLDAALAGFVVFLIVTCMVGASSEGPFFETRWGGHLFILLLCFLAPAVLLAAVLPMSRWLRLPLDQLPDLYADSGGARSEDRRTRRIARRRLVALVAVVAFPLLVVIFYFEEDERGERVWNQYKQQQEARGDHLDPSAFVPPLVSDDQNFASTPFLAPLFDFIPGTQQARDTKAVERTKALSPRYDAASARVKPGKQPRSNTWASAGIDLPAWYAAFLKGTNAAEPEDAVGKAFRTRYGLASRQPGATAAQPATNNPQLPTDAPTLAEAAGGVLDALAEAEPILEELRAASLRPHSRFNLYYDIDNPPAMLLPHYTVLKRLFQVLQLRASAELALGRTNEAAADIQFMFRLTDAIRNEPILIAHLVRLAELQISLQPLAEGLARHQWSEPQLRGFEDRLRQFDFLADARLALQGERVFFGGGFIDYIRRSTNRWRLMDIGSVTGEGRDSQYSWQSALLSVCPRGWYYLEKVNYSRMFQDYFLPTIDVAGHRVSPDACRRSDEQLAAMLNNPPPVVVLRHQFFSGFLLPALTRSAQKFAFGQAGADAAGLACALERYRLAHGQFPDSLNVLVPEFITHLPQDVITGQPLKYRRTADDQYLLYSVGWNQTDDGGVLGLTKSGETIDQKTGDWVWRL